MVRRFAFLLTVLLWPVLAAAQEYEVGHYGAFIGPEDLYNSQGVRHTDPVQILRQDRANVHRFGIVHPGDDTESDRWFFQSGAREAMAAMFQSGGGIHPAFQRMIVAGNVYVFVRIYAVDGNFTALRVEVPG